MTFEKKSRTDQKARTEQKETGMYEISEKNAYRETKGDCFILLLQNLNKCPKK